MSSGTEEPTLTARSVVLSVLLGTEPAHLPVGVLVRTTELFGISEGTTRTALSRMVASGELTATPGTYSLASTRLRDRQRRQADSRAGASADWSGMWLMAIVGSAGARSADERAETREQLIHHRFGELREGVWTRPDNLGDVGPHVAVEWFETTPRFDGAELCGRLWDLEGWTLRANELRRQMAQLVEPLESGNRSALRPGFVLSASVLRHFQHDPLLPASLISEAIGWNGPELRTDYDRYDTAYRAVLREWFGELKLTNRVQGSIGDWR